VKVVLTGASGFVGTNLSRYLLREGVECESINLRDEDWQLPGEAQALIHLAGKAHDTGDLADEQEYFSTNTDLTAKLFDRFLAGNIRDFIYFSSVKAVADAVDGPLTEEHPAQPTTAYGRSKRAAEEYLLSKPLPPSKRLIILRPCAIYGAGSKGNLDLLYSWGAKGLPWPLAAFENKRSFAGIGNLCYILHRIVGDEAVPSGIYNIADDDALSTNKLMQLMAEHASKKVSFMKVPPKVVRGAARLGDIFKLPLNSERLRKLTEDYVVCNRKIKAALNITNMPGNTESSMVASFNTFKKN